MFFFIHSLLSLVGLREKFGKERVFNTPLCEQGIAGFGIGNITQIRNFKVDSYQKEILVKKKYLTSLSVNSIKYQINKDT